MAADVLVISVSAGENLRLAERFAAAARGHDLSAEVLSLTGLSLPLFNPLTLAESGIPAGVAELNARLDASPRWAGLIQSFRTGLAASAAAPSPASP